MPKKSVFCIATSESQAATVVDRLRNAGFSNHDISALFPDKSGTRDFAPSKGTKAPGGAATDAGTGAVLGGALGWLAGIGALAIPGVGPLVAAGPMVASLSGAVGVSAVGRIAGALIVMGIPEFEAQRFEAKVKAGGILISVHTEDADEVQLADQIFQEEDVDEIAVAGEAAAYEKTATR